MTDVPLTTTPGQTVRRRTSRSQRAQGGQRPGEAAVAAMRSCMAADAVGAGIQPETAHATRCTRSVIVRCRRHGAAVGGLVRSFRADGAWVKKEKTTSSEDERRSDWYVAAYAGGDGKPRVHGHFDFKCVALAGVLPAGKVWPEYGRNRLGC